MKSVAVVPFDMGGRDDNIAKDTCTRPRLGVSILGPAVLNRKGTPASTSPRTARRAQRLSDKWHRNLGTIEVQHCVNAERGTVLPTKPTKDDNEDITTVIELGRGTTATSNAKKCARERIFALK